MKNVQRRTKSRNMAKRPIGRSRGRFTAKERADLRARVAARAATVEPAQPDRTEATDVFSRARVALVNIEGAMELMMDSNIEHSGDLPPRDQLDVLLRLRCAMVELQSVVHTAAAQVVTP